jgi:PAS domain S-box-containing protein
MLLDQKRDQRLTEFAALLSQRIDALKNAPPTPTSLRDAFRMVADTIPSIMWTARSDGEVTYFNRCYYEFTGASDTDWLRIIHPEDREAIAAAWLQSVSTGEPYCSIARFRDANGKYHAIQTSAQPVRGDDQQIVYWIGSSTVLKMPIDALKVA